MVERRLQSLSADHYIYSYEENEAQQVQPHYIYSYEENEAQQVQPQNQTLNRFEQSKIIKEQVQIT